jgi:hypothetical protein
MKEFIAAVIVATLAAGQASAAERHPRTLIGSISSNPAAASMTRRHKGISRIRTRIVSHT